MESELLAEDEQRLGEEQDTILVLFPCAIHIELCGIRIILPC